MAGTPLRFCAGTPAAATSCTYKPRGLLQALIESAMAMKRLPATQQDCKLPSGTRDNPRVRPARDAAGQACPGQVQPVPHAILAQECGTPYPRMCRRTDNTPPSSVVRVGSQHACWAGLHEDFSAAAALALQPSVRRSWLAQLACRRSAISALSDLQGTDTSCHRGEGFPPLS